jgi:hypothetical protein
MIYRLIAKADPEKKVQLRAHYDGTNAAEVADLLNALCGEEGRFTVRDRSHLDDSHTSWDVTLYVDSFVSFHSGIDAVTFTPGSGVHDSFYWADLRFSAPPVA